MPHLNTNADDYDHTASAFIIRTDESEPKLLMHMHKKLGKLTQPAGHVEVNENSWQAILREIVEETGYDLKQLKVLQPTLRIKELNGAIIHPESFCANTHEFPFKDEDGNLVEHHHQDLSYAFIADGEPLGSPVEGETNDFRWLTAEELRSLDPELTIENVRDISLHAITEVFPAWKPVELSEFKF